MKGERTTQSVPALPPRIAARFRTGTCSFTILPSSPRRPHLLSFFFFIPSFSPPFFLRSRAAVNGFSRADFRGRRVAATETLERRGGRKGGDASGRFCRFATRCIVSLLHSFLILRSTCVANSPKTVSETLPLSLPFLPTRVFLAFARARACPPRRVTILFIYLSILLCLTPSLYRVPGPVRNSRDYRGDTMSREIVLRCPSVTRTVNVIDAVTRGQRIVIEMISLVP